MRLLDFDKYYPNEDSCKKAFKEMRLKNGVVCPHCGCIHHYWKADNMHLLTATKHTFSALELQRQLGRKRYQPVWEMMHKLRTVMGQRDSEYFLTYSVELDEAFFTTTTPKDKNGQKLNNGSGSERKAKVIVMAESIPMENPNDFLGIIGDNQFF